MASLVLGLVWVFGIGSILAVIFGFVARRQIRQSGGRQTGGGMALAGIILGLVGVISLVLWIALIAVVGTRVYSCHEEAGTVNHSICTFGNSGNSGTPFGNSGISGLGRTANGSNSGFGTGAGFGGSGAGVTQSTLNR